MPQPQGLEAAFERDYRTLGSSQPSGDACWSGIPDAGDSCLFLQGIRKPVKEMIRVMDSAEGKSLQARARVRSHDEIGQLAERLNRMLARVESFNAELGQKVQDATAELARRNEELKRINEELFETQKTLARSERLAIAGQLAAGLAHEIGTPLNSISGHVQLLARQGVGGAAGARRLEIIERQIDSIVRSVKQFAFLGPASLTSGWRKLTSRSFWKTR